MTMPRRPDQYLPPGWRGMLPASAQNIRARTVTIIGPDDGVFTYDALGNLRIAEVGQRTTDPVQGITCQPGISTFNGHSAVINLVSTTLGAFFQYQDLGTATQGIMILSVASTSGTDPVTGATFPAGLQGIDPAFGDFLIVIGATISMGVGVAFTQNAQIKPQQAPTSATNPYVLVNAPEQTTAKHMQMLLQGASPDGTRLGQCLIGQASGAGVLTPVTQGMLEVQGPPSPASPVLVITPNSSADPVTGTMTSTDTHLEFQMDGTGQMQWGSGAASPDCTFKRQSANLLDILTADLGIASAGRGLRVKEGANAKQGTATLAGGTATVADTSVTATSRILLTAQDNNTTGALRISARAAGTSFTITSSNAADSGIVAYEIFEPA